MRYFLGADVGATKTHVLIADETGRAIGFGRSGSGNPEAVGYDGLAEALRLATEQALATAGLLPRQITGAGFGVAGYDWPSEKQPALSAIARLGLTAPVEVVNDALIGLLAGSEEGWGVAVVAGTGCNCWGWDHARAREGRVTGGGMLLGEAAGGTELVARAVQAVAYEWTKRGPATQLTPMLIQYTGAGDVPDLLHGLMEGQLSLTAHAAPLVFEVAAAGDPVAIEVIRWAGRELGELAKAVIHQLQFEALAFDVVLVGNLFNGGPPLIEPFRDTVLALAPGARFIRLNAPPVIGAVLLGMEQIIVPTASQRLPLIESTQQLLDGASAPV